MAGGNCSGEVMVKGYQYRLRAGSPMPIQGHGQFKYHTFMAEKSQIDNYLYTNNLPSSNEFRGQGGDYMSASFTRLEDRSGNVFSGKIIHAPEYIEEGALNITL
jgi:hypothetical protein